MTHAWRVCGGNAIGFVSTNRVYCRIHLQLAAAAGMHQYVQVEPALSNSDHIR